MARLGREDWSKLKPDDIAWVVEWQLTTGFPWIPPHWEDRITAAPPTTGDVRHWTVTLDIGRCRVRAMLPARDLARVIRWCYSVPTAASLSQPPPWVQGSILAIRFALHRALSRWDPLNGMGYPEPPHQQEAGEPEQL